MMLFNVRKMQEVLDKGSTAKFGHKILENFFTDKILLNTNEILFINSSWLEEIINFKN